MNFLPGDYLFLLLDRVPFVRAMAAAMTQVCRTRIIVTGTALAAERYSDSVIGPILIGSIFGFGGTLMKNMDNFLNEDPPPPGEFSAPTWASTSALGCSAVYYLSTRPIKLLNITSPLFSADLVQGLLTAFFIMHGFVRIYNAPPLLSVEKSLKPRTSNKNKNKKAQ